MRLYFEFEDKRRKAEVNWPKNDESIVVHLTDKELTDTMPGDLFFDIKAGNEVAYTIENPDDTRLIQLQNIIKRKLQELVG